MTSVDRVRAVTALGFTERQSGFLVTVMLHAGVCLSRQYCAYARIVRGQKVHDFFSGLRARRLATAYDAAHRRAHIHHVHGKRLYRAIGEPDNRNRRPATLARAIERLMLLDAVLADRDVQWLGAERDKREHFERITTLRSTEMPHLAFGGADGRTVRYFPDKLPIGMAVDRRTHVFVYLLTTDDPAEFRGFLYRHAELLRALASWEVRLLVPGHLASAVPSFEAVAREELAIPLRPEVTNDLCWFFNERQRLDRGDPSSDPARFRALRRAFSGPRFWTLYRAWRRDGEGPVYGTSSPVLKDALARGTGRVTTQVLSHKYQHLSPLVGSA
jgi:hypothetical protein